MGLTLAIAVFAVMARDYLWAEVVLGSLAIFFITWGMNSRGTEMFIGGLPLGKYMLKLLEQIDSVLSPHDHEYERHIRGVIIGYDNNLQKALRRLLKTRNPYDLTSQEWEQFFRDCLVDSPFNNRGGVKAELRDIVGRVLDEIGA
jgi:membrane-associated protease RseP (regulator of RpoE activity)